jgi:hypothetical protein
MELWPVSVVLESINGLRLFAYILLPGGQPQFLALSLIIMGTKSIDLRS